MSRRGTIETHPARPDPMYRNRLVNMFVSRILRHGKRSLAYRILYNAMKRIQRRTKQNPLAVLRQAALRTTPRVAVKARRKGAATYQVPVKIRASRGKALAIRWILASSSRRAGRSMASKLSYELIDAARQRGNAIRKREETHRMAEANRTFAHVR